MIAQVNQGNSYITFPTDMGNIEPLWFEANLSPGFYIRKSKNSRLMGVLTPQITAYYSIPLNIFSPVDWDSRLILLIKNTLDETTPEEFVKILK